MAKGKTRKRKSPKAKLDVVSDVLHLFGGFSFTSEELAGEVSRYCKIIRKKPPHITQIGKQLARLGYVAKRQRLDGKRVRVYTFKIKLAAAA